MASNTRMVTVYSLDFINRLILICKFIFEQLMLVCCLAIVAVALADKDSKEKQDKKKEDGIFKI